MDPAAAGGSSWDAFSWLAQASSRTVVSAVRRFRDSWSLPEYVFQEAKAEAAASEVTQAIPTDCCWLPGRPGVTMRGPTQGEGQELQFTGPAWQTGCHTSPVWPLSVLFWDPCAPHLSLCLRASHFLVVSLLPCECLWVAGCLVGYF